MAISAAITLQVACKQEKPEAAPNAPLRVVVTLPPMADFVEQIAGDRASVEILLAPGQSPHTYEPTPQQVAALVDADVYFRIGLPFEDTLIPKIKGMKADLNIVDLRQGLTLRKFLPNEAPAPDHSDEPGADPSPHHDHAAGAPDPHTWLNPKLVAAQVTNMTQSLAKLDPAHAAEFNSRAAAFQASLTQLDNELSRKLAPYHGREFFVYHPSYGYFADAYRLTQVAVEAEGKEPSARQLAGLIERARKARVHSIFVQPQFNSKGAEVLADAIGAEVVMIDPLPRGYLSEMQALGHKLAGSFAPPAQPQSPSP